MALSRIYMYSLITHRILILTNVASCLFFRDQARRMWVHETNISILLSFNGEQALLLEYKKKKRHLYE